MHGTARARTRHQPRGRLCRGHPGSSANSEVALSRRVLFRSVSNRIVWKIFGALLIGSALVAVGAASAAQLTLDWVDNSGGTAYFTIERKTETTGTYAPIATTGPGTTTYADLAGVAGTTYCYR